MWNELPVNILTASTPCQYSIHDSRLSCLLLFMHRNCNVASASVSYFRFLALYKFPFHLHFGRHRHNSSMMEPESMRESWSHKQTIAADFIIVDLCVSSLLLRSPPSRQATPPHSIDSQELIGTGWPLSRHSEIPWQCAAALTPMLSGTHSMPVVLVLM